MAIVWLTGIRLRTIGLTIIRPACLILIPLRLGRIRPSSLSLAAISPVTIRLPAVRLGGIRLGPIRLGCGGLSTVSRRHIRLGSRLIGRVRLAVRVRLVGILLLAPIGVGSPRRSISCGSPAEFEIGREGAGRIRPTCLLPNGTGPLVPDLVGILFELSVIVHSHAFKPSPESL